MPEVRIVDEPPVEAPTDGSAQSRQTAEVTLPRSQLEQIWSGEHLERLARTYWAHLSRVSLGVLRILYTRTTRSVVFLTRPFVLLSFGAPEYDLEPDRGVVTWRIERGLLVAKAGRDRGYLRITVERLNGGSEGEEAAHLRVSSEVTSFYPMLAAARPGGRAGALARLARWFYTQTQLRIHVIVTNAFLRSLAKRDLETSVVGALRASS